MSISRTLCALVGLGLWGVASAEPLPHLQRSGETAQLIVGGKPWIALAGEVFNSSASSAAYMAPIWDRLAALNLNTVITPAYWELVEPEQGRFDFTLVDDQIRQARKRDIRIVLLWFGTLKNAKSTYAPSWVRVDHQRFPRARTRPSSLPFAAGDVPLSVFDERVVEADARAFARLMDHLAQTDQEHTVIAVQIENETGILGDSRDRSAAAEAVWNAEVPAELMKALTQNKAQLALSLDALWARSGCRRQGRWKDVFGDDWQADEIFMAWGVSRFVEKVASAGKARLALPMYANAWIGPQKPGETAGAYPSGGPVPRVFDIWRAGAPSLDWLSPDIYVDDFDFWADSYVNRSQALFVPESRFIVGNLFKALGHYRAIGFSPFGIEAGVPGNQMSEAYGLLRGIESVLADAQARGAITGFALAPGQTHQVKFGDYVVTVRGQREFVSKMLLDMGIRLPEHVPDHQAQNIGDNGSELTDERPVGLIVQLAPYDFLVVGKDLNVNFAAKATPGQPVEIARVEEGRYSDGKWLPGRVLNGDERLRVVPADHLGMVRIQLLHSANQPP